MITAVKSIQTRGTRLRNQFIFVHHRSADRHVSASIGINIDSLERALTECLRSTCERKSSC